MNGRLQYLKDVLGVESWIRPHCEAKASILLKSSWSNEEKTLVEKIISGAGLSELPRAFEACPSQNLIIFDSNGKPGKVTESGKTVWYLGPLRAMLVGSAPEMQAAKREVWNLLKLFKEEVPL